MLNNIYWVVGATLHGVNTSRSFLGRGYWQLGTNSKPRRDVLYMGRFNAIAPGDRIAIKSCRGKGTGLMKVVAIGIVKEIVVLSVPPPKEQSPIPAVSRKV